MNCAVPSDDRTHAIAPCRYCEGSEDDGPFIDVGGFRWHRHCASDLLTEFGRALDDQ